PLEAIEKALAAHLPARHTDLMQANRDALRRGAALAGATAFRVGQLN
ncbi:MAG: hypothetical protein HYZ35_06075, partial [Chloroflexi bacterium]|nr:hypothetical protein [Chloroflexota bacterium]